MDIMLVIIGWALGQLGVIITDDLRRIRRASILRKALMIELRDLKIKLVYIYYLISLNRGSLKKEGIIWANNIVSKYDTFIIDKDMKDFLAKFASMDEFIIDQSIGAMEKSTGVRGRGRQFTIAALNSPELIMASIKTRELRHALEIKNQLAGYNQLADEFNYFMGLTYQSNMTGANHKIVSSNLSKTEEMMAHSARKLAERIDSMAP